MTEIGTIIDGKYEILKEIGRGGMSTVYLAMDSHLNKQWAVKEIRKKGTGANDEIVVNSLLAEANLMKRLDHPALPRIVDIIDNGITIYVVMDYIEGESLDKILKEYGVQDEEKVIEWAKQICDALSYLHSQKPRPIVYRDMKPANIMLKPEGNIKIIDFGIAREYKEQNLADTKVLGTRGFAPPEAYNGQTTPRSDIYSLGMTMHNLLTGVDPRMGDGYVPVRQINPNLSEGIELIIDKCVQPAEENRYQSCADLIYDLEHPDLITSGYKKKQKRKIIATVIPFVLSVIMAFSGLGTALGAKISNDRNYNIKVNKSNDIKAYEEAVVLEPANPEAYIKMVEYYQEKAESDDGFTNQDLTDFELIYTGGKKLEDGDIAKDNSAELKKADPQTYGEINFDMAVLCFNHLVSKDDNGKVMKQSKREQCLRALDYFALNEGLEGYTPSELETNYKALCELQINFLSNFKKDAVTAAEFKVLFNSMNEVLESISEDENMTPRDYLYLCSYISNFLVAEEYKTLIKQYGVEEEAKEVFYNVENVINEIDESTLQSEYSKTQFENFKKNYKAFWGKEYQKTVKEG